MPRLGQGPRVRSTDADGKSGAHKKRANPKRPMQDLVGAISLHPHAKAMYLGQPVCVRQRAQGIVQPQRRGFLSHRRIGSSPLSTRARGPTGAEVRSGAHQEQAHHVCSGLDPTGRSGAPQEQANHVSTDGSGAKPDAKVNPGEDTGLALSPESLGFSSSSSGVKTNKQGKGRGGERIVTSVASELGGRASPQDWLGPGPVQEWKYNNVTGLLGIAKVSTTLGRLVGADVKSWRALSLTSIVAMFRATGIVHRVVLPSMQRAKLQGSGEVPAGPQRCPDTDQVGSASQAHLSVCEKAPTSTCAAQVQLNTQAEQHLPCERYLQHFPQSDLQASGEKRSRLAFPLIATPQLRGVSNEEAENFVRYQVQQALHQVGFADLQASQVTELLIQESFADIVKVVASQENLVGFAVKAGQLRWRGPGEGQWLPEPIGIGEQSAVPIGSSEVKTEKELGRADSPGKDSMGGLQLPFLEPELQIDGDKEPVRPSMNREASSPELVWFILLKKGKLPSFISASPSMRNLLSSNELISALGWALGVLEAYKADKDSSCRSCEIASPGHHQLATSGATQVPLSSAPACKHYVKGFCNRGQCCKYRHEAGMACPEMEKALQKTTPAKATAVKVCPRYARGYCKRGEQCNYSHQAPSADINAGSASLTALRSQRRQPRVPAQAYNTLSVETIGQGLPRSEPVASSSQESEWQPNPCELIRLKNTMAQESQAVQTASRKFTAPRPEQHFQKGVKIHKLGSQQSLRG